MSILCTYPFIERQGQFVDAEALDELHDLCDRTKAAGHIRHDQETRRQGGDLLRWWDAPRHERQVRNGFEKKTPMAT